MNRSKRIRAILIACVIPLLFVSVLTWIAYAQMRQNALNRALIAEIKKQNEITNAKRDALLTVLERRGDFKRFHAVPEHRDSEAERIFNGTADRVRLLLDEGADPNARDETGSVPHSFWDHLWILLHLRKNATPPTGEPALALAMDAENTEIMKTLAEKGANANVRGHARMTPLEWSSILSDPTLTLLLLGRGVNVKNREGAEAVLIAAVNGNVAVLKALLDYGADINARLHHADTPLIDAIGWRTQVPLGQALATVKFLLDHHADVNIKGPEGDTPLSAARYGMETSEGIFHAS